MHLRDSVHFDAQTPPGTPAGPGAGGKYRLVPGAPGQVTGNRADSEVSEATLEGRGELEKEELLCLQAQVALERHIRGHSRIKVGCLELAAAIAPRIQ